MRGRCPAGGRGGGLGCERSGEIGEIWTDRAWGQSFRAKAWGQMLSGKGLGANALGQRLGGKGLGANAFEQRPGDEDLRATACEQRKAWGPMPSGRGRGAKTCEQTPGGQCTQGVHMAAGHQAVADRDARAVLQRQRAALGGVRRRRRRGDAHGVEGEAALGAWAPPVPSRSLPASTSVPPRFHRGYTSVPPWFHLRPTSVPPPSHLHPTCVPPRFHLRPTSVPPRSHLGSTTGLHRYRREALQARRCRATGFGGWHCAQPRRAASWLHEQGKSFWSVGRPCGSVTGKSNLTPAAGSPSAEGIRVLKLKAANCGAGGTGRAQGLAACAGGGAAAARD